MATIAQEGATSPRFAENHLCPLFEIPATAKEIREECRKHKTTFRRVGRALSALTVKSATMMRSGHHWGNLAKLFKQAHPLLLEDKSKHRQNKS